MYDDDDYDDECFSAVCQRWTHLTRSFCHCSYKEDVGLEDAVHTAILTLKEGFEGEMTENNIELGVVQVIDDKPVFRVLTPAEVKDYLGEVQ